MFSKILALLSLGVGASLAWAADSAGARLTPLTPHDTYFSSQWNLQNNGPGETSLGRGRIQGNDHAHIAEAWKLLYELDLIKTVGEIGRTIRLAVIDDGFDLQHEDLKDRFVATRNFGGPTLPGNLFSTTPTNFHGTLVTGIAAATADNHKGIAGVCPACQIIAARMGAEKPTRESIESYYQRIFDWVMEQNPDVINCSWGPDPSMTAEFAQQLIDRISREGRQGKGTIVVFAAGNAGQDLNWNYFANHPKAVTVGASDSFGHRYTFSNYGQGLDVLAPTSGGRWSQGRYVDPIWTTDNYAAPDCQKPGVKPSIACSDKAGWTPYSNMAGGDSLEGRYSYRFSHTSSAAPIVSGVASLMLQANPNLAAAEVQTILQQSADQLAPAEARYDVRGFSTRYGYGRVNALRAVALAYEMSGKLLTEAMRKQIDVTSPCTRKDCWILPSH